MMMMQELPQQIEWTCKLLVWHGLYQHPQANDKDIWYVYPEHAIAGADDEAINEWSFCESKPSYTSDIIKQIMEDAQELAIEDRAVDIRCSYECSNYQRAEEGETSLMWLTAEDGPLIEGYGGVAVEYVGVFNAETREYVWHPRTRIDKTLVERYFHHVPTQKELSYMCHEGVLYRLDELPSILGDLN